MPPTKRTNSEDGGQAKRMKTGQANGTTPKTDSDPQNKAITRSGKNSSGGGQQDIKLPKFLFREEIIPPLTKPDGFPCFSDGDVLIILDPENLQYQYRLHSQILRNSSVFRELLSVCVDKSIPKKFLATNTTNLSFCLEFNPESVTGLSLHSESLFHKVTLDNYDEILTTQRQKKEKNVDNDLSASYDGSADASPASFTNRAPAPSPDLTPFADVEGDGVLRGCPERGMSEAYSGSYSSSQFDDNHAHENSQLGIIRSKPKPVLEPITTTATPEAWSTPEGIFPATEAPETFTSGSGFSAVETRQCTVAEELSGDCSATREGFLDEVASEAITRPRTPAHGKEIPRTQVSGSENSPTSMGISTTKTTVDATELGPRDSDTAQTLNSPPRLQEGNSGRRAGSKVGKTASLKEAQDDECRIISSKSRIPSPPASPTTPIAKYRQIQGRKIKALHSLFRMLYDEDPMISSMDMNFALFQVKDMISVAKPYKLLPKVRAHIGHSLAQRGRRLYQAILREPIQWLKVSVDLENKIIFQEAVVHLVGKFPDVDNFARELFPGVPEDVIGLLYRKVVEIDRRIYRVNELLMTSAIYESGVRAQLNGLNKTSFDVSILIHCWREWFIRRLSEARTPAFRPEEPSIQSKLGMLYRDIAAGGDTYLPEDEVMDSLRPLQLQGTAQTEGFLQWDTAAYDLKLLKDYASGEVQEVCANTSQLNPADGGFKYLTCTQVGAHEYPWVSAPRN
ncbi:hypothetical protein V498_00674 [Pseudogymnoascus sp. VKM F-4517 (FW-2822)]|nr:hypothetical protein V498_00674 [Pseudogymnoascus sp. VKM F-4517 (FW-2822)]